MGKKLKILRIMLVMVLFIVRCEPKPTAPPATEAPGVEVPAEATGEASIDEVAADISDTASIEEELDTSELDDIDSILSDIENI